VSCDTGAMVLLSFVLWNGGAFLQSTSPTSQILGTRFPSTITELFTT